jgi:tetratricopeptide (TPR) repeat protein
MLSSSPVRRCRDGRRAVALATEACQKSEWKYVHAIEALAAAYAEIGEFENAVQWQQKALDLSPGAERARLLSLYKSRKPFRFRPAKTESG